jgi:hypothetical protein
MKIMSTHAARPSPEGFLMDNQRTNSVSDEKALQSNITPVLLERSVSVYTFTWRSRIMVNSMLMARGVVLLPMLTVPSDVSALIGVAGTANHCILG